MRKKYFYKMLMISVFVFSTLNAVAAFKVEKGNRTFIAEIFSVKNIYYLVDCNGDMIPLPMEAKLHYSSTFKCSKDGINLLNNTGTSNNISAPNPFLPKFLDDCIYKKKKTPSISVNENQEIKEPNQSFPRAEQNLLQEILKTENIGSYSKKGDCKQIPYVSPSSCPNCAEIIDRLIKENPGTWKEDYWDGSKKMYELYRSTLPNTEMKNDLKTELERVLKYKMLEEKINNSLLAQ